MKSKIKYKNFFLFLFLLFLYFLYLDQKIVFFLKNLQINYKECFFYIKIFTKLIEKFYKIFVIFNIFMSIYSYIFGNKILGKRLILGIILGEILSYTKYLFGRARPKVTFETLFKGPNLEYEYASFPSGHTLFIFTMVKILSHQYPKYRFLFYFLAFLVAAQRLFVLAHFPSDILVGAFLGYQIGKLIIERV